MVRRTASLPPLETPEEALADTLEAAPPGVDVEAVARSVCSVDGVRAVHELHLWSVTAGFEALAAHVVVAHGEDRDRARREVEFVLQDRYGIEHTTLQVDHVPRQLFSIARSRDAAPPGP